MNYMEIKYCDIANGPGIRTSLFVCGCRRHCKNCFNESTWDFEAGEPFSEAVQEEILKSLEPYYVDGLTLLGGEPFEPENQRALYPFVKKVRERFSNKSIWAFSGNTLEEITDGRAHCEKTEDLLALIDVLVDGPFVEDLHNISLRFRGSSNQRILDLKKTLAYGEPVKWEDAGWSAIHMETRTD